MKRYFRNRAGRWCDARTRKFVPRTDLEAGGWVEVDGPDPRPGEAPRAPEPQRLDAFPEVEPHATLEAKPAPEPTPEPHATLEAEPAPEPTPEPHATLEAEPAPEPAGRPVPPPVLDDLATLEAPSSSAPGPALFEGEHDDLCPAQNGKRRCACGAEYADVAPGTAGMVASGAARALDALAARVAKTPVIAWDVLEHAPDEVLRELGVSRAEVEMGRAAEAEAWRVVLAKYGTNVGPYAAEITLAVTVAGGLMLRAQAGRALARRMEARRAAQAAPEATAPASSSAPEAEGSEA